MLIIGVLPPPIGGTTVHIKRLMASLQRTEIEPVFVKTHHLIRWAAMKAFLQSNNVHIHASNPFIRFALAFFCMLLGKNSFLTFHGNIGRYGPFRNWFDLMAIRTVRWPIVINQPSFVKALKVNKATQLASAFIPPQSIEALQPALVSSILALKQKTDQVFCTNASNADSDKEGNEIYQCSQLLRLFGRLPNKGLIISDPSGNYRRLWEARGVELPANIILISSLHDFNAVIALCDVMIRFTTTDGDAISVKEALYQGKPVIASNVVDRPAAVHLVDRNIASLEALISAGKSFPAPVFNENGFDQIYHIYQSSLISNQCL